MQYIAFLNGQEIASDVVEVSAHRYRITLDDRTIEVEARAASDNTFVLSMNGGTDVYTIEFDGVSHEGSEQVLVRGQMMAVEVLDLRKSRLREAQQGADTIEGVVELKAPMAGKVVAQLLAEGQAVTKGQGVVVVEAMKMENEIKSPKDGTVTEVKVDVGAAVNAGDSLCKIE